MKIKIFDVLSEQIKCINVSDNFYKPYPDLGGSFYMEIGRSFGFNASLKDKMRVDNYEYDKNPYLLLKEGKTIKYHFGDTGIYNNPEFIFEITMIGE